MWLVCASDVVVVDRYGIIRAARDPCASFRPPQPLACPSLKQIQAQVACGALISGYTSAFHAATASSSRSIAWRTGTRQDQMCLAQQPLGALHCVADVEQLADQRLDPSPASSAGPRRTRALAGHGPDLHEFGLVSARSTWNCSSRIVTVNEG
jgi:hypothetical protein